MNEGRRVEMSDVVTLKSGGPLMTVEDVQEASVRCVWFTGGGTVERSDFPPEMLRYRESRNLEVET